MHCQKCGKELGDQYFVLNVFSVDLNDLVEDAVDFIPSTEDVSDYYPICEGCFHKLERIIKKWIRGH